MKILLITNTASSVFNFRLRLIEQLINSGHSVCLLVPSQDKSKELDFTRLGVNAFFYDLNRTTINPFNSFVTILSLVKKIKEISPDVVFSFFPKPVIFGTLAASCAGIKRNYSMLEGLGYCFTRRKERPSVKKLLLKYFQVALYKISLPHSNCVMFLNEDDRDEIIYKNKIKVKHHHVLGGIGVDLNRYEFSSPPDGIVFTMISRLLIDKGVREYVQAASYVKNIYPNVRFDFIGGLDDNLGGVKKEDLAEWVKKGDVNFKGVSNNIPDVLKNTSVFVLPSYREGVPRSTQEAMAIGRPIITTNVPGCKETVINGVNGFLIPPWDGQTLAEKMIYFIENKSEIERMGKESRIIAERKFDEDVFCDNLIKILLG
ncbi:glycosyltransferase family 4 protein [Edwardsiella ictaluri]|uniref:glycosyltransferase family 4 protein n=2 Tax=Edwardsiella ictaluri TaxID=67780 RepID=UPI0018DDDB27|nr:glycosyltransferase family 4 protein [Edwardsiella ictaluri]QPW29647.1 glycosyltransferase family 4 protein [Edwardsiella ictaluri]WJH20682.1 glycosyltransferase family 4 protein [Edwardsiella ictaluri]BEI12342.1 glycosyltransferase family 4 protein [Edwardsiella ictaluri]BEI19294.1 glycosyltransferase family 4 protein [Edwardsiella ictaluri]